MTSNRVTIIAYDRIPYSDGSPRCMGTIAALATTDHSASSHGHPVVIPARSTAPAYDDTAAGTGAAYGPVDLAKLFNDTVETAGWVAVISDDTEIRVSLEIAGYPTINAMPADIQTDILRVHAWAAA